MNIDKNISDALGIESKIESKEIEIIPPKQEITKIEATNEINDETEEDFNFVREQLKELIRKGNLALDEMGALASELESARAFEVYAGMLDKVSSVAKDLYDLHKKKKDISPQKDSNSIKVEKAVFVGTAAELLSNLKKEQNKNDDNNK